MEASRTPKTPKNHGIGFSISGFTIVKFREKMEEMEAPPETPKSVEL